jgi:dGTPase
MLNLRERTEQNEAASLSPYATKSAETLGRDFPETACDVRTEFQRDRDRITHSKSFRRLMHKTQVFISPEGDHYRTRLTHTLEVTQISRSISRALSLNEDLTEAIALGHDLGHTPFGHTGEDTLDSILSGGFRHNEQSARVVGVLENGGKGLNLTREVVDGILNHRSKCSPSTLEGKVVRLSDKIAYINHDIDDAIRAGVLDPAALPADSVRLLGGSSSRRVDFLIRSVISASMDKNDVTMAPDAFAALAALRDFMFATVYASQLQTVERAKIKNIIVALFDYYMEKTDCLPEDFQRMIGPDCPPERAVADYIAGMTDRFAMRKFMDVYVPASWGLS